MLISLGGLQVRIPDSGGRVIVASDGVWDGFENVKKLLKISRIYNCQVSLLLLPKPSPLQSFSSHLVHSTHQNWAQHSVNSQSGGILILSHFDGAGMSSVILARRCKASSLWKCFASSSLLSNRHCLIHKYLLDISDNFIRRWCWCRLSQTSWYTVSRMHMEVWGMTHRWSSWMSCLLVPISWT